MQLNAVAVHDLTLAVLPGMVERGAGGILISGSAAGNSPIPYNATYAASKAFVNTFSESLRGELRRSGVHVTLLAPGPVRTDLPDEAERSLVERLVPDFLWISTEHTARASLNALERNKMRVVPGLTSKAMSVGSGYAPRAIVAPIVGSFYKSSAAADATIFRQSRQARGPGPEGKPSPASAPPGAEDAFTASRIAVLMPLFTVGFVSTCSHMAGPLGS